MVQQLVAITTNPAIVTIIVPQHPVFQPLHLLLHLPAYVCPNEPIKAANNVLDQTASPTWWNTAPALNILFPVSTLQAFADVYWIPGVIVIYRVEVYIFSIQTIWALFALNVLKEENILIIDRKLWYKLF